MNLEEYIAQMMHCQNKIYLVYSYPVSIPTEQIAGMLHLPYPYIESKNITNGFKSNTYLCDDLISVNSIHKLLIITKFKHSPFINIDNYINLPLPVKKKYKPNKFIILISAMFKKYGYLLKNYKDVISDLYKL